ncbi:hypothetical protein [Butyrivibrio sp. AC2005]|uniref:hypothetical protein n=1 Tax=Butyrivibrio sp. AC2005 TaxID=1280672 RepID=UPI0003F71C1F|nr:hypothetical protein [Butyrivibrio sp. AC2005]
MSNGSFKADENVEIYGSPGPGGRGRAYDWRTGKSGYVTNQGYFVPDEDKEQQSSYHGSMQTQQEAKAAQERYDRFVQNCEDSFKEGNKEMIGAVRRVVHFFARRAGKRAYINEMLRTGNEEQAIEKAKMSESAVELIALAIVVHFVICLILANVFSAYPTIIMMVIFLAVVFAGPVVFVGIWRVMHEKTFFLRFERRTEPVKKWKYVLIIIGSILFFTDKIRNTIEQYVISHNEELAHMRSWETAKYAPVGDAIFFGAIAIAIVIGIIACALYTLIKPRKNKEMGAPFA